MSARRFPNLSSMHHQLHLRGIHTIHRHTRNLRSSKLIRHKTTNLLDTNLMYRRTLANPNRTDLAMMLLLAQ